MNESRTRGEDCESPSSPLRYSQDGTPGGKEDEEAPLPGFESIPEAVKRQAEESAEEETQSKRSRRMDGSDYGQLGVYVEQDAVRRLGSESEIVGHSALQHGHSMLQEKLSASPMKLYYEESSTDGRSRRAREDDDEQELLNEPKHEAQQEEQGMEDNDEAAEDDEGHGDIEEVVKNDSPSRVDFRDEDTDHANDELGEHKPGDDKEECAEPPRDEEVREGGKEELREEMRDEAAEASAVAVTDIDRITGVGMPEEKLGYKEVSSHVVPALVHVQAVVAPSFEHKLEEKKENGSVEQKLVDLPNGLPKLDEIHAAAPKHLHMHQHQQRLPLHQPATPPAAPKPAAPAWGTTQVLPGAVSAWGNAQSSAAPAWGTTQALPGGGPSFASMLASTNTFAAMLQTGLSPLANQQPISIKLAGTNAFSAVLASGTFSAVLAQGQDGKEKGRGCTGSEKEDDSHDKGAARGIFVYPFLSSDF